MEEDVHIEGGRLIPLQLLPARASQGVDGTGLTAGESLSLGVSLGRATRRLVRLPTSVDSSSPFNHVLRPSPCSTLPHTSTSHSLDADAPVQHRSLDPLEHPRRPLRHPPHGVPHAASDLPPPSSSHRTVFLHRPSAESSSTHETTLDRSCLADRRTLASLQHLLDTSLAESSSTLSDTVIDRVNRWNGRTGVERHSDRARSSQGIAREGSHWTLTRSLCLRGVLERYPGRLGCWLPVELSFDFQYRRRNSILHTSLSSLARARYITWYTCQIVGTAAGERREEDGIRRQHRILTGTGEQNKCERGLGTNELQQREGFPSKGTSHYIR